MSETTSASIPADAPAPVVTAPSRAFDDIWTVESQSKMAPQTTESLKDELAAPLMSAATPTDASGETPAPETPGAQESAPAAPADDAPPEAPAPEGKPKKQDRIARLQAEVHQLTRTKYETRAELDAAQAQLVKVRAEIAKATPRAPQQTAPAPTQDASAPPVEGDAELGAKPTWADYETAGRSWDEFNDAREAWLERKVELKLTREMQAREQRIRESAQRDVQAQAEAQYAAQLEQIEQDDPTFRERAEATLNQFTYDPKVPDFRMDVVRLHEAGPKVLKHWVDHPEELKSLTSLNDRLTHAMMHAVRSASDPVPLLSYLATHPQETDEISRLPRERALIALGKISAHVEADPPAKPATGVSAPPVSRAAAPIRPVGGTRTTGDAADIYDLPIEDFIKERSRREIAARRRP